RRPAGLVRRRPPARGQERRARPDGPGRLPRLRPAARRARRRARGVGQGELVSQPDAAPVGTGPRDPEEAEAVGVHGRVEIDPGTTVGAVHLTVADLARSVAYYEASIGLHVLDRGDGRASLGA